jgi:hypothetical protein
VSRALIAAHWPLPKLTGIRAAGGTQPRLAEVDSHQRSRRVDPPLRPGALLDARREQIDYCNDVRRADIRPAAGRINPAKVGFPVELRQGVEAASAVAAV